MKKIIRRSFIAFVLATICFYMYNCPFLEVDNNSNNDNVDNNDITNEVINTDIIEEEEQDIESWLTEDVITLLEKYPDLSNIIKSGNIRIPIIENMIPQGIAVVKKYIFISYYSNLKKNNSICYIMNKKGDLIRIVQLDTNSHVGGIGYDEKNELIWIPDNDGIVNVYSLKDFFSQNEVNAIQKFDDISDGLINYKNNAKSQIDYLYIDNNILYIGNFSLNNTGKLKKYEIINNEGLIELSLKNSFLVPNEVQGITIKKYKDKEYIIMSQSYGRYRPSYLNVFEYNENITNYRDKNIKRIKYKLPPMLEQIFLEKNFLYIIFESNAPQYYDCLEKVNSIFILDFEKILKDFYDINNTDLN